MSKQNKVNPGMYTQRGRLTQDDAARELRKQRQIGSQHTTSGERSSGYRCDCIEGSPISAIASGVHSGM